MQKINNWQIVQRALFLMWRKLPALLSFVLIAVATALLMYGTLAAVLVISGSTFMMGMDQAHEILMRARDYGWAQPEHLPATPYSVLVIVGIIFVLTVILNTIISTWFYQVINRVVQDEYAITAPMLIRGVYLAFPMFVASFIFAIAYSIGNMLLVIPGIFVYLSWYLFPFVLINEPVGPWQALMRSNQLMSGHRLQFFGLIVSGIFGLAGLYAITRMLHNIAILESFLASVVAVAVFIFAFCVVPLCAAQYYHILRSEQNSET